MLVFFVELVVCVIVRVVLKLLCLVLGGVLELVFFWSWVWDLGEILGWGIELKGMYKRL